MLSFSASEVFPSSAAHGSDLQSRNYSGTFLIQGDLRRGDGSDPFSRLDIKSWVQKLAGKYFSSIQKYFFFCYAHSNYNINAKVNAVGRCNNLHNYEHEKCGNYDYEQKIVFFQVLWNLLSIVLHALTFRLSHVHCCHVTSVARCRRNWRRLRHQLSDARRHWPRVFVLSFFCVGSFSFVGRSWIRPTKNNIAQCQGHGQMYQTGSPTGLILVAAW